MRVKYALLFVVATFPCWLFGESEEARLSRLEEEIKKLKEANAEIIKKLNESPVIRRRVVPVPPNSQEPVKEVEPTERVGEFEGHTYKFIPTKMSWNKAKLEAEKLGGYLVCINSDQEQKFIADFVTVNGKVQPTWIGLNDEEVEGEWKWVNGETVSYKNWQPNQPDNHDHYGSKQNYVWLGFKNSSQWDDMYEHANFFSIVEFDKVKKPGSATKPQQNP